MKTKTMVFSCLFLFRSNCMEFTRISVADTYVPIKKNLDKDSKRSTKVTATMKCEYIHEFSFTLHINYELSMCLCTVNVNLFVPPFNVPRLIVSRTHERKKDKKKFKRRTSLPPHKQSMKNKKRNKNRRSSYSFSSQ